MDWTAIHRIRQLVAEEDSWLEAHISLAGAGGSEVCFVGKEFLGEVESELSGRGSAPPRWVMTAWTGGKRVPSGWSGAGLFSAAKESEATQGDSGEGEGGGLGDFRVGVIDQGGQGGGREVVIGPNEDAHDGWLEIDKGF